MWWEFLLFTGGLFVGGTLGFLTACLCVAADDEDSGGAA